MNRELQLKNKLSILNDQYDRLSRMPIADFDDIKRLFKTNLDPYFWGNSYYIFNRRKYLLDDIYRIKVSLLDYYDKNCFNWNHC